MTRSRHGGATYHVRSCRYTQDMKNAFVGFTAVWQGPTGEWPVWIAARSRAHAGICALVTFAVLESQAARPRPTA